MSVDPRLELIVRSELTRRDSRARPATVGRGWPRAAVASMHRGQHDVLAHLHREAARVVALAALADLLVAGRPVAERLATLGAQT